jgi:hypothetical protein
VTPALYSFESADSLARFGVWIAPVAGGGIVGLLSFWYGGWWGALALVSIAIALIVGLRASITVSDSEAVIVKKWFFVPYRTYRAPEIDDVWFGGDWGLEEGAMGVVVKLAGREVHIGTSKNMRELHDALWPQSAKYRGVRLRARDAVASPE